MVPVIALQTFWRTSGTYLWNKFRSEQGFCAYYEPLNEVLFDQPALSLQQKFEDGIVDKLGHPPLNAHYFAEYPIEAEGGVRHFMRRFSYEHYALAETDRDDELAAYFEYLIAHAAGAGLRPVFKFCRMTMRQRWFARNFATCTILVVRDFNDTFRSYLAMAEKSVDFLRIMFRIILKNRDDPHFAPIAGHLGAADPHGLTEREMRITANRLYTTATRSRLCDLAFFFWATYIFEGLTVADEVFDVDLLGSDVQERARVTAAFRQRFAAPFDFSDLGKPGGISEESVSPEAIALVRESLRLRFGDAAAPAIPALSAATRDRLAALI